MEQEFLIRFIFRQKVVGLENEKFIHVIQGIIIGNHIILRAWKIKTLQVKISTKSSFRENVCFSLAKYRDAKLKKIAIPARWQRNWG